MANDLSSAANFVGGGVSGALIRALDWSTNPLGAPAGWPGALKALVRTMLSTRQPMSVFWGPELINVYNDGFIPVLGEKHPDAMGRRARDCWSDAWPVVGGLIADVMSRGTAVLFQEMLVPVLRKGRLEDAWWNFSYSPAFDEAGSIAGVLVIVTETTSEVAVRRQLEAAKLEAEHARQKLHDAFTQAPVPMAQITGPDMVFVLANPSFQEMIGRTDVVGLPFNQVFAELPENAAVFQTLQSIYKTGRPFTANEFRVPLDRGGAGTVKDVFFKFTCQPVLGANGSVEGVIIVAVDVTSQVSAKRQLETLAKSESDARAQAERASRAKDEFLAILGHELRNPLAPMQTALRLIEQRGFRPNDLAIMERQVGTIVRLVDDLLDVSRIAGGKIELRKRRLELSSVVQHGLETASPLLEERRHAIDLQVPDTGLPINGDAGRLSQVVSNLLTNAAKYSTPGSAIHITAVDGGGRVQLKVRDHGIGIPADMLGRVFDMFVQQPQALDRAAGGIGLGLTIVRSLVALHDGTVTVHSGGPGTGSEFVVDLPLATETDALDARPHRDSVGKAVIAPPGHLSRVLVIDDNPDAAESIAEYIAELGHDVKTAHDGPSALDAARAFKPTVCLVDIGLPVMDGYELARRLRKVEGIAPNIRLIALTGYGLESDRRRSAEAGFDGHFVKPVDLDVLAKAVSPGPAPPRAAAPHV